MTDKPELLNSFDHSQPATNPLGQGSLHILLVEDNPGDARLVEEMFRDQAGRPETKWGFDIDHVTHLKDAIKAAKHEDFDLVLLDMGLPDSKGIETVRQMRAANARVAIVVLTGNEDQEVALRVMRAGAQDYLVKGQIDGDLLMRAARYSIERIFSKKSLEREASANQEILASLSAHIAVLDPDGRIIRTNQAWEQFSRTNGGRPEATSFGVNYLEVVASAADDESPQAVEALNALKTVLIGASDFETIEYPCHSPQERRWFMMRVTPLAQSAEVGVVVAHENITSRRLAEIELENRSRELQTILEHAPDIVARYDLEGRHLYISPSIEKYSGRLPEYYLGKTDEELEVPNERVQLWLDSIEQVVKTGKEYQVEYEGKYQQAEDAALLTFQATLVPEFGADKQIQSVIVSAREITALRQAQVLLESREKVLQAVSFASQLMLASPDWRPILPQVLEQLGQATGTQRAYVWQNSNSADGGLVISQIAEWVSHPDLALQGAEEFRDVHYVDMGFERWRQLLAAGANVSGSIDGFPEEERAFLEPQGIKALIVLPIFSGDEWWGFIGFDNVETRRNWDSGVVDSLRTAAAGLGAAINRHRSLKLLEERERRFRSMVQNAGDIITIVDAEGTITYESPALERVMGFKPEDVLGLNVFDPVHPEDRPDADANFKDLLLHPDGRMEINARLFGADGEQRTIQVVGTNLLDDPAVGGVVLNSRDITQKVKAEQELHDREQKYRLLAENSIDVIWQMDLRLNFTYVSPSSAELVGYSPEEITGTNLADNTKGVEFFKTARAALGALQRFPDFDPIHLQTKLLHKDGTEIEVELTGKVLEGEDGLPIGLHGVTRDIRSRVAAERALRQSEQQYRSLFSTIQDAIVVIDTDRRISQYNPGFAEIFGCDSDELIGKSAENIYSDEADYQRVGQLGRQVITKGGDKVVLEGIPFRKISGENFIGELSAYSLVGRNEEVSGAVAVIRDITEREKAQQALVASEERYRRLFTSIQDGIDTVDESRTITQCNPAFEAMFGYSTNELIGRNSRILYASDEIFESVGTKARKAAYKSDTSIEFPDVRLVRKDGSEFHAEISAETLFDNDGNRIGNVGVFRDVTERLKAQQALRSSEKRYRSLFSSIRDAILVADVDRKIVQCNPAFTEVFGYSEEEIRGKPTSYIYKDHEEFVKMGEQIQEMRQVGLQESRAVTVKYRRKSGELFPGETGVYTLQTQAGHPIGNIGLIRDVTVRERQQQEQHAIAQVAEALREASAREQMPPIILGQLLELLDAGGAEMVLTNSQQDRIWVEMGVGSWSKFTGMELDIHKNIAGEILHSDITFQTSDLNTVEKFLNFDKITTDKAAIAVSMKAGEVPVGVVWVARQKPFIEADIQLLRAIANMAGNALQRAGLHEETRERAQQMAAVSLLGQSLAEQLDEFTIFEKLAQGTKDLLPNISTVIISRFDTETELFHCAYGEHDGTLIDVGELEPVPLKPPGQGSQSEAVRTRRPVFKHDLLDIAEAEPATIRGGGERDTASGLFVPMVVEGKVWGVLQAQSYAANRFSSLDSEIMAMMANTAAVALQNSDLLRETHATAIELALAYDTTLEGWARALELRDKETEGHTRRVADLTIRLASKLGVPADEMVHVRRGSLVHDIGKMGIPDSILLKPGKLTEDEWEVMRRHPQMAYDMLESVDFLMPALQIPLYHHERWDGSGYPQGLKAEDIPLTARVFAVVDVYDALSSDRPYRKAWPPEKVQDYLKEKTGVEFDPRVVEAFFEMLGFSTD